MGEKTGHWWLDLTQTFAIALIIATLIRSFYMPIHVITESVSPQLEKGSLAVVQRTNRHFSQGEIIAYKKDNKCYSGFVAETKTANSSDKNLLVTDYRNEEFNVPLEKVYGKVIFGASKPSVHSVQAPNERLSLVNYDQGLSEVALKELRASAPTHLDPVSYTHLTLPTILLV